MTRTCDWTAGPVPDGHIFVMGDNRGHSADSTRHMCQRRRDRLRAGRRVRPRRPRRRQGLRAAVAAPTTSAGCTVPTPSRTCPTPELIRPVSDAAPRSDRPARRRALRLRARPAPGRASSRSPGSTRPAVVPARARWWPARRSCRPARPGSSRGSPTPSCSPRRPASAATTQVVRRAARLVGGGHRVRRVRPARHARRQRRGAAAGRGAAGPAAGVRAHRRVPRRRARRPRAGHLEGGPGGRLHRGRLGAGQGDPRPDHARAGRRLPAYDFRTHKGYITDVHAAALDRHGPCPEHRMRFVNVRRAAGLEPDRAGARHGEQPAEPCRDAVRGGGVA